MPLYHFVLKTRHDHIPDRDGSEWPNEAAAHEEAVLVAHDLMRNQGVKTHAWRIEVCDEDLIVPNYCLRSSTRRSRVCRLSCASHTSSHHGEWQIYLMQC